MVWRAWSKIFTVLFACCFVDIGSLMNGELTPSEKKYLFPIIGESKSQETPSDSSNSIERSSRSNFVSSSASQPVEFDTEIDVLSDYEEDEEANDDGKGYQDDFETTSSGLQESERHSAEMTNGASSAVSGGSNSEVVDVNLRTAVLLSSDNFSTFDNYLNKSRDDEHGGNNSEESHLHEQQEKLLLQMLMKGYERDVRPVKKASQPVVVRVGITLTQIFDMDEKQQVLTTNVWLDQEWNDEMLRWDPKDYGGLETIRLPCERIWLPDIVLYNNADDYTRDYMRSRAMVTYDGTVFWPPPTKFRSTCSMDVTYFPFDNQICFLKLGSWTYNGFQVDVTNRTSAVDLSNYLPNGEWELIKAVQQRNVVYYSCCPEPFPDVTITLVIRRKTLYYIYNIVLPCIMLSTLTLLVFCIPPDSGEKIALGITVLLAFSVFMLAINESLPETSESIPLIGVYLTIVMAITSVSVVMTVCVLNLHYLGPQVRPVPHWLMRLLPKGNGRQIRQKSFLAPVTQREPKSGSLKRGHIFITQFRRGGGEGYSIDVPGDKLEDMVKETSDASSESITNENTGNYSNSTRRPRSSHCESSSSFFNRQQSVRSNGLNRDPPEQGENGNVLQELLIAIRQLIGKQDEIEIQNNLVAEWRLVAQVVDRILFWIFFTFTMSSSTMILLILPIYKRNWYGTPLIINGTELGGIFKND